MSERELRYDVTFGDFRVLQGHMARRIFGKNRRAYAAAMFGVVLCAVLLAAAVVITVEAGGARAFSSDAPPYPVSLYLLLDLCLIRALFALVPAVRLRMKTLRMQVSDDGPLLGPTRRVVEPDGLIVDRGRVSSRYAWSAFQGVEVAKNAVILPLDNGIGLIVPGSAFSSNAARLDFAAAIAKRIESQKVAPGKDEIVAKQ